MSEFITDHFTPKFNQNIEGVGDGLNIYDKWSKLAKMFHPDIVCASYKQASQENLVRVNRIFGKWQEIRTKIDRYSSYSSGSVARYLYQVSKLADKIVKIKDSRVAARSLNFYLEMLETAFLLHNPDLHTPHVSVHFKDKPSYQQTGEIEASQRTQEIKLKMSTTRQRLVNKLNGLVMVGNQIGLQPNDYKELQQVLVNASQVHLSLQSDNSIDTGHLGLFMEFVEEAVKHLDKFSLNKEDSLLSSTNNLRTILLEAKIGLGAGMFKLIGAIESDGQVLTSQLREAQIFCEKYYRASQYASFNPLNSQPQVTQSPVFA
jgi:hypothetical protein